MTFARQFVIIFSFINGLFFTDVHAISRAFNYISVCLLKRANLAVIIFFTEPVTSSFDGGKK